MKIDLTHSSLWDFMDTILSKPKEIKAGISLHSQMFTVCKNIKYIKVSGG